ncbi:MAG: hypothetical protein RRC34_13850 [Lentisphaeria bacterium]|nr:hypothetical protein [Lentisphaeria bacterium]
MALKKDALNILGGKKMSTHSNPFLSRIVGSMLLAISTFLLCMISLSCNKDARKSPEESEVPLVRLLACPEKYENRFVSVCGYLHLEVETDAIYLSKEHYESEIGQNALYLWDDKINEKNFGQYNNQYVWIMGRFRSQYKGRPLALFPGMIYDVRSITPVFAHIEDEEPKK